MSFTLPDLGYDYNALEVAVDAQTMEIHHSKHHQTYITNLNNAVAGSDNEGKDLIDLVKNSEAICISSFFLASTISQFIFLFKRNSQLSSECVSIILSDKSNCPNKVNIRSFIPESFPSIRTAINGLLKMPILKLTNGNLKFGMLNFCAFSANKGAQTIF